MVVNVEPLDGGWGWFVVLACCLNNFLLVGLARTIGVLFAEIVSYYNTTSTVVAFIMGLNSGLRMFGGPVASYLFLRLDGRLVVMMGGFLVSLSFVTSAYMPNPYLLLLSYSILGGIGGCFIFTPSYVILNQYFLKRRGKALGLGTLGAGLGSIALAPLNAFLLAQYGYSGTMLIIGGIMLNNCVAGALYRPIGNNRVRQCGKTRDNEDEEETEGKEELKKGENKKINPKSSHTHLGEAMEIISEKDGFVTNKSKDGETESGDDKNSYYNGENKVTDVLYRNKSDYTTIGDKHSATTETNARYAGLNEDGSNNSTDLKTDSKYNDVDEDKNTSKPCFSRFELCTYPSFVIYCFQIMSMPLVVSGYLLWLPVYAVENLGQSGTLGALLISVAGVSDICGRLIGGAIFDIPLVRRNKRLCHTLVSLAMAGFVITTGVVRNYWVVMVLVVGHGLTEGTFHSQRTSVVSEVIPEHLMAQSVGSLIFMQGFGTFFGPIMGGAMLDVTGSCHWTFFLNGGLFGMFSLFCLLDYMCRKKSNKD